MADPDYEGELPALRTKLLSEENEGGVTYVIHTIEDKKAGYRFLVEATTAHPEALCEQAEALTNSPEQAKKRLLKDLFED